MYSTPMHDWKEDLQRVKSSLQPPSPPLRKPPVETSTPSQEVFNPALTTHKDVEDSIRSLLPFIKPLQLQQLSNLLMFKFVGPIQDMLKSQESARDEIEVKNEDSQFELNKTKQFAIAVANFINRFLDRSKWQPHTCGSHTYYKLHESELPPYEVLLEPIQKIRNDASYRQCMRKVAFRTQERVNQECASVWKKWGYLPRPYFCKFCAQWHLTTSPENG